VFVASSDPGSRAGGPRIAFDAHELVSLILVRDVGAAEAKNGAQPSIWKYGGNA
jgi:hypothetical protein